jgi:hypothetical protein
VTDNRVLPPNLPADRLGNEGTDLLRNIERLQFSDLTLVIPAGVAGSAGDNNSPAVGAPTISGTPELGMELTASIAGVTDADNATGAVTGTVDWIWESELEPGSNFFQPIVRIDGVDANGNPVFVQGETLQVTVEELGLRVRVIGRFMDDAGVFETVRSAPVTVSDVVTSAIVPANGRLGITGICAIGDTASAPGLSCITNADGTFQCRGVGLPPGALIQVSCGVPDGG